MATASEDGSNLQDLRRCINDLVSLLALPAIWTGKEPQEILKSMVNSLVGMLRLDFIYTRVHALSGDLRFDAIGLARHQSTTSAEDIRRAVEPWLKDRTLPSLAVIPSRVGEGKMRVQYLSLGLSEEIGLVLAGSQREDFPNQTETILLHVAVNQTAIALNAAILASQRRKAEEALARQLTVTRTITDNSTQALFMIDKAGYCTFMNPVAERMFGFTFEEMHSTLHETIHHHRPDGTPYPGEQCPINRALVANLNIRKHEDIFIRKNGELFPALFEASVIFDEQHNPAAAVIEIKDITEQKQAEKEREQHLAREKALRAEAESANTLKDEFLATISHELRTPLNAMLGWTRILRTNTVDPATTARALEAIERSAKMQAQLIEDLLDVSAIISGKMRLNAQPVDVATVIQAAMESVRPAADAKSLRLKAILDPGAGPVFGDPTRLQQIVWNLLANAIKFTSKDGRVQVRLERVDSHVEIAVSDTGIGIQPNFLPYVFDRFRQADSTMTRSQPGLGLGLAIVRHLVELHGGDVHAYSQGEEKGAVFTVKLPLLVVRAVEMIPPEVAEKQHPADWSDVAFECPAVLEGLRILVVEDEPEGRELLITILRRCNSEVCAVGAVAEALEELEQFKPDVLVCDIQMPGEDGFSLIQKVRQRELTRNERLPAAALTAHAGLAYRMRALSAGFDIHLPKPVEPAELVAVIASLASRITKAPGT